jgi:hypothetical protein
VTGHSEPRRSVWKSVVAAVGSTFPAVSTARTANVCQPAPSPSYDAGDAHRLKAPPSRLHVNVPAWSEVNANTAVSAAEDCDVSVVCGRIRSTTEAGDDGRVEVVARGLGGAADRDTSELMSADGESVGKLLPETSGRGDLDVERFADALSTGAVEGDGAAGDVSLTSSRVDAGEDDDGDRPARSESCATTPAAPAPPRHRVASSTTTRGRRNRSCNGRAER